ncbi:MAG: HdeD family acid-resistance protein [Dysgonomonas sp.]
MENGLKKSIRKAVKNWWISLLIGILCVALGIWCAVTPLSTFLALTILFVAGFIVTGIFEIGFAITNRDSIDGWGWTLAVGIIDLVLGIVLIANPMMAPAVLVYFIIFWLMFQSFWGIGVSIDLSKSEHSGWGWLLAFAILGLILSIILLFQPVIAGEIAAYMLAAIFVVYGIFRIMLSIKLKSLNKYL